MRRHAHGRFRLAMVLAGVLVVVGVTASSTAAQVDSGQTEQAVTITLAHWSSSAVETSALRKTLVAFQRAYPSIKVKEITLDPYPEGMLARFAARKPPDLFYVDSSVYPDWKKQGVLEPLNARMVKAGFSPKPFYQRLLAAFRDNKGTIYGFPKDWSPLAMEVNTRMLAAASVQAPQTWTQLRAALTKLKNAGQAPACLSVDLARILAFMYQNNGGFLNATKTQAIVDTTANATAVSTYFNWLKTGLAQTPAQLAVGWCGEALGQEKASIIFEGNWVTSYMTDTFPTVRWKTHPMIRGKARGNLGFTVSYSIGKHSKYKEQAFTLLTYLTGPKGMAVWTKNVGYLPSRRDVKPPAGRAVFLKEAEVTHAWQFAPGFSKVIDTAQSELQAAYEGKQTVKTALQNIQAAARAALRRGR